MSDNTTNGSNPALTVDKLIKEFDKSLSQAGVKTVTATVTTNTAKATSEILDALTGAGQVAAYITLSKQYGTVLEIVAEIIAELDEEPYFSSIQLPELPEIGHDNIKNL